VDFAILGPFQVTDGSRILTPAAPKLREVLALLVIRCPEVVLTRSLIEELWGENPPKSALTTLQTYVYQLRKSLTTVDDPDAGTRLLNTKPFGYAAQFDPTRIDAHVFEKTAEAGRAALTAGDDELAAKLLRDALSLWRGPAFSDVVIGPALEIQATWLEEARLRALELRLEADLRLGRDRELISELKTFVALHPLNESLHAKLMLCLYRADRRFEAIEIYQHLRRSLVGELGLEPSLSIRRLHQALLSGDPSLDHQPKRGSTKIVVPTVPAQLPWDIGDFVDRAEALQLAGVFDRCPQGAMPVATVVGPAGSGKTTLAVHVAHTLRDRFPDGQFHADLRGRDRRPADPRDVLGGLLTAVGVRPEDLPASLDERSQLFRTWAADRKALIMLDDAAGIAQVRPLLPGGAGCGVILTSRSTLSDLPGAATIRLWTLDLAGSVDLLTRAAGGEQRFAGERRMVEYLARICECVPLALRVAGMRLAANPHWSAARLATRIEAQPCVLDELSVGDLDVRRLVAGGCQWLTEEDLWALGELAALPTDGFSLDEVVAVLGIERCRAEDLLERWFRGNLVDVSASGHEFEDSYQIWPLVRLFAVMERDTDRPAVALAAAKR
jgi:DNA-binding SARP family transcriptional activator